MDIKDYIASGILEEYVLGATSPQETQEVECMSHIYPKIQQELEKLQIAMEQYVSAHAVAPPAYLKDKILAKIDALSENETEETKVIGINPNKETPQSATSSGTYKWLAAASITLLVLSSVFYVESLTTTSKVKSELTDNAKEKQRLKSQLAELEQTYAEKQAQLAVLNNPNNKVITMKGVEKSPSSIAKVYWNPNTKEVFIAGLGLPEPPKGKQYQLWALLNGQPIDAGVFELDKPIALQKMKAIENAQAFAVTLEDEGGKPSPDLTQLYVMGNV